MYSVNLIFYSKCLTYTPHFHVSTSDFTILKMLAWILTGLVVTGSPLTVLPGGLPHRCGPSGFHPGPHRCLCWPSGFHPGPRWYLRLPLEGLWPRGALPNISTGGLLSAYPTGISESQVRMLKTQMTNARPTSLLPLATLLDFPIVCIMVR